METPPRRLQALLALVINRRELEPIAGDLMEEYVLTKRAQLGRWGANLWYLEQIMSLIASRLFEGRWPAKSITLLSLFNGLAGAWLFYMEQVLGHPGHGLRALVDIGIVAASLLVLAWLIRRDRGWLMGFAGLGILGTAALGVYSLSRVATSAHFEGYAFVIGITLCLQGLLTLIGFVRLGRRVTA